MLVFSFLGDRFLFGSFSSQKEKEHTPCMIVKMIATARPARDCSKGQYVLLTDAVAVEDEGTLWRVRLPRKREMAFAKINWTLEKVGD